MPLLLIGYDNHKIEINIRLHNEKDGSHQVKNYSYQLLRIDIDFKDLNFFKVLYSSYSYWP